MTESAGRANDVCARSMPVTTEPDTLRRKAYYGMLIETRDTGYASPPPSLATPTLATTEAAVATPV